MQILQALKKDHQEVQDLLEQLAASGERAAKKREQLFGKMKMMLEAHSQAEQQVFYNPLMQHDEAEDGVMEAEVEHQLVERLLAELEREPKGDKRWTAKCSVLMEMVKHHVKEEESQIFKLARKAFGKDDLTRMGEEFESAKQAKIGGGSQARGGRKRRSQQSEARTNGRMG